jgi:hypothetical protein
VSALSSPIAHETAGLATPIHVRGPASRGSVATMEDTLLLMGVIDCLKGEPGEARDAIDRVTQVILNKRKVATGLEVILEVVPAFPCAVVSKRPTARDIGPRRAPLRRRRLARESGPFLPFRQTSWRRRARPGALRRSVLASPQGRLARGCSDRGRSDR